MLDREQITTAGLASVVRKLTVVDLRRMTNASLDAIQNALAGVMDVDLAYVPYDTALNGPGWPLARIIAHLTASAENRAIGALTQARGAPIDDAYAETPVSDLMTVGAIWNRLAESRRLRLAMLQAWPDQPRLDVLVNHPAPFGETDARGTFVLGLLHDADHLDQIRDTLRQAQETRQQARERGA